MNHLRIPTLVSPLYYTSGRGERLGAGSRPSQGSGPELRGWAACYSCIVTDQNTETHVLQPPVTPSRRLILNGVFY